jgi:hypothetical protein
MQAISPIFAGKYKSNFEGLRSQVKLQRPRNQVGRRKGLYSRLPHREKRSAALYSQLPALSLDSE